MQAFAYSFCYISSAASGVGNWKPSSWRTRTQYGYDLFLPEYSSIMNLQYVSNGVSNHQPHDCLFIHLFRRRTTKHQSSASLAFVLGIHRWPVNSPHKGPVTRKMFPFDDVIMPHNHAITLMVHNSPVPSQSVSGFQWWGAQHGFSGAHGPVAEHLWGPHEVGRGQWGPGISGRDSSRRPR